MMFDPIDGDSASITPKVTIYGFSFEEILLKENESCAVYEGYFFKLASFVRKTDSTLVDSILKKCPNANTLRVQLRRELNTISEVDLKKKISSLGDAEKKKILWIYSEKKSQEKRKEIIVTFNQLVTLLDKNRVISYEGFSKILAALDNQPNSVLKYLSRLLIAIRIKNNGWAESLFEEIVNQTHEKQLFNIEPSFFTSAAQYRRFEERLELAMIMIEEYFKDKIQFEMISRTIDLLLPHDFANKKSLEVKWSLRDIRQYASSIRYGKRYPWFWFSVLYSRASEVEAVTYLKENLTSKVIQGEPEKTIQLLRFYYPADEKIRKVALRKIKELARSKDYFDQYIILELIKNNIIKRELAKTYPRYRKARVILERSFYRNLIEKGIAINFCLYNLYKLGDFDDDLLWWMVL